MARQRSKRHEAVAKVVRVWAKLQQHQIERVWGKRCSRALEARDKELAPGAVARRAAKNEARQGWQLGSSLAEQGKRRSSKRRACGQLAEAFEPRPSQTAGEQLGKAAEAGWMIWRCGRQRHT